MAIAFVLSLLVFKANGDCICLYDSLPNSLVTFQAVQRHRVDFDNFRKSYLFDVGAGYVFTEAPNGHLSSIFPVGTGIVATPFYLGLYLEAKALGQPLLVTERSFEDLRRHFEKEVASLLGALTVALFFMCARRLGATLPAVVATIAFAFGSEMWTIGSQALWQHGPVNLFVLLMIYGFLRAERADGRAQLRLWLLLAGAAGGFLWVIRPTAIPFGLAGLCFAAIRYHRSAWPSLAAFLVALAPGVAWNLYFFHALLGGYAFNVARYFVSPLENARLFGALLFSPSRGLFTFTPIFLFSLAGAVVAFRRKDARSRLMAFQAVAAALLVLSFAFFTEWWGGFSYGPRYLSDVSAVAALLLIFAIPPKPLAWMRGRPARVGVASAFALCLVWSIGVQAAGSFGEERSDWNGIPFSVDFHNDRLFSTIDSQIAIDARFAVRRFESNPTLAPGYVEHFAGMVLRVEHFPNGPAISTLQEPAAGAVDLRATLENVGSARWYGYASGVFYGQTLVRVRITDASGNAAMSEQHLFVRTEVAAGEQTSADGTLSIPSVPGHYSIVMDVIPHRIDQRAMPRAPRYQLTLIVR